MKILFVMFDGGGNIPPQVKVARALRNRGADIHVLGHGGIRERIEREGLPFEVFADGRPFNPVAQRSLPAMMADFAKVTMDRRYGHCAVDVARRIGADAVVVDVVFAAAITETLKTNIPTVAFVHFFYRGVQDFLSSPVGWLQRLRGITPLRADPGDLLQIVTARTDLDPVRGCPPVRHVGVVWQGPPTQAIPAPVPRILVSLSTCAYAGQRRMLQNILDAIEPLAVEATVTVGPAIDSAGLRVPANASMHSWLDHDEVLAGASLVVGHGGHSTAMRALSFGVPMVVMPANPLIDQRRVGAQLAKVGAGISLPKNAGITRIREAIEKALNDPAYRAAASGIGARIREHDGADMAADAIEEFLRSTAVSRHR
ncbi:glycosyltransferase [Mycobacterium sp. NPDC051804]|uniref:glycosyltransferase n=1 Tax=Mycobacterium sp. NPDC051804 TaxID=3364295 RepID=UPI0037BB48C4